MTELAPPHRAATLHVAPWSGITKAQHTMDYATDDERLPPRLAKIDAISAQQIVPRQLAVPAGVDDFLKLSRLRQQPPSHRADPHQATRPLGAFVFDDQGLAEHFLGDHVPATLTRHPSKKGSSSPSRVRHGRAHTLTLIGLATQPSGHPWQQPHEQLQV